MVTFSLKMISIFVSYFVKSYLYNNFGKRYLNSSQLVTCVAVSLYAKEPKELDQPLKTQSDSDLHFNRSCSIFFISGIMF